MSIFAMFRYEVRPGRFDDFMAKLAQAAGPEFDSEVMPKSVRVLQSADPDPEVMLIIEYDDIAAYNARTAYENANPAWRSLFEARPDAPERLIAVQLFTELPVG